MSAADDLYRELIEPVEDRMMRAVVLKKIHRHPNPHGYILYSISYDMKDDGGIHSIDPLKRNQGTDQVWKKL